MRTERQSFRSLPVILGAGIAGVALFTTLDRGSDYAVAAPQVQERPQLTFHEQVNAQLSLEYSTIVELAVDTTPAQPVVAVVPVDGELFTLDLEPFSLLSEDYELLIQLDDGSIVPHEPGPVNTLRGFVVEHPDALVAASMQVDGFHATIAMPGDEGRYWVEPVPSNIAGAQPDQYVVYHDRDVHQHDHACGNTEFANDQLEFTNANPPAGTGEGGVAGGDTCFWFAEIAFDADWEYFDGPGVNSVTATENRIIGITNSVSLQYENDVNISYIISGILVRTSSSDPYTAGTIGGLLDQFRSVWNSTNPFPRDVAELYTGRNLSQGVIGIAYTVQICTSSAYNVVEDIGNAACRSDLAAHELGHNWSALHCSCPNNTMNSGLTCANQFSQTSINSINSYRQTRQFCLDNECVPANDNCADFIDVTDGVTQFVTSEVTDTDGPIDSLCDFNGNLQISNDIWYRYIAPCDGQVTVDMCTSAYDTKLAVYQGCPTGANQAIACDDNTSCNNTSTITFDVTNGVGYIIRVGGNNSFGVGIIDITGPTCIPAPSNDNCSTAGPLNEGITAFTTIGATTDGPTEASCGVSNGQIDNDVWYRFFSPCDGPVTISSCGADFDTKIAVYGSSCPTAAGAVVGCNDDQCGTASSVTFNAVSGNVYRVRVGGHNGAFGSGALEVVCGGGPDPCTGDTNSDNVVDVLDLVNVILDWDTDGSGNGGDVNTDGIVNVNDLLDVILAWGACP